MGVYIGRASELGTQLSDDGLEYALSIGRRAPMHQGHVFCLRDILQAGLLPVIGIGSANFPGNPHYDPIKNPLTPQQQKEQLKIVVQKEFPNERDAIEHLIFVLEDVGDNAAWGQNVIAELSETVRQSLPDSPVEPSEEE